MPAMSLTQQVESRGLSLVTVGDRVEVRRGQRVISFGADAERAAKRALERLEEDRLRNVDKRPEDLEPALDPKAADKLIERTKIAAAATEAFKQPVPTKGAYEDTSGVTPADLKVSRSIVKAKYRDKYKANGYNCGDLIAGEMQAYICEMKGTRLAVNQVKLREVAEKNGVWDARYESHNVGMQRMNIGNRLRNKYNNGEKIDIGGCVFELQFD